MAEIKLNSKIRIGQTTAYIIKIYDTNPETVEVIYSDQKDEAIVEDAKLVNGNWEFAIEGPCGAYAKNSDRLREFLYLLK